jgi:translation elongation factor EF-1beta
LISKKYNEVLRNLESKVKDKRDLNIAKLAIADLAVCYSEELTKISESLNLRLSDLENKVNSLENHFENIDNLENLETEVVHLTEKISCPYCEFEFLVEYDDTSHEVICPKCNNLIELDWGEFEDDM